jgi:anaerobic ribonucleoside-triphosphate reductase
MAPGEMRHHNMLQVKKRDGSVVDFDIKKIENAMSRAFVAEHKKRHR